MSRQNFLSRESFVEATEIQAKQSLLSIPVFATCIRFVSENKKLHSYQFSYQLPQSVMKYCVDVSILPLNDQYTRVCLRGKYFNGHSFNDDDKMAMALKDFESAMQAAIKGNSGLYKPHEPKKQRSKKFHFSMLTAPAFLFLLKKFS